MNHVTKIYNMEIIQIKYCIKRKLTILAFEYFPDYIDC